MVANPLQNSVTAPLCLLRVVIRCIINGTVRFQIEGRSQEKIRVDGLERYPVGSGRISAVGGIHHIAVDAVIMDTTEALAVSRLGILSASIVGKCYVLRSSWAEVSEDDAGEG